MSNTATVTFTTDEASGNLSDIFINSNPNLAVSYMQNYLSAMSSGNRAASINVKLATGNAVSATNTAVITAPVSGDAIVINGVSFVAGTDFAIGGTDTITTTNIKTAINSSANALISGVVTASSSSTTLTLTATTPGTIGNMITMEGRGSGSIQVTGDGTNASGTLTCVSVASADTAVINGTTLTATDKREKTQVTAIADTGAKEATDITCLADTGAFEVSTITLGPDVAGSLNSTYFVFYAKNTGGASETKYYVWYNINGAGVDPAVAAATAIPVTGATNATANTLATATRAAVTSVAGSKVTVTGATNQCIITGLFMGNATNAADGGAATGFTITPTNGVASNLNKSYFTYVTRNTGGAATNSRYVWYNVNGEGVDPAPGGTGIAVALSAAASANTVASSTRTALAADTKVVITGATTHCIITNAYMGTATDTADGSAATGFTFTKNTDGAASNLLNKYFVFYSAANATKYYMWYNVNSEGTDPAVAAATGVVVAIGGGASASNVALTSRTAFLSTPLSTDFLETGATDKIIFQAVSTGVTTDTADGGAATGFTFSTTIQGGAVGATQFQIGTSDTLTATSLKTCVNAQATLTPIVVATSSAGVVTITAIKEGIEGNDITLAATGGVTANVTRLSGGLDAGQVRLTGGTADTGSTTYNFGR